MLPAFFHLLHFGANPQKLVTKVHISLLPLSLFVMYKTKNSFLLRKEFEFLLVQRLFLSLKQILDGIGTVFRRTCCRGFSGPYPSTSLDKKQFLVIQLYLYHI